MDKRFWICGLLVSVAAMVLGFVVHGVLLHGDYAPLVGRLIRAPDDTSRHLPAMLAADVCIGFAMTWLYRQIPARAGDAWRAGLRFGFAAAVLSVIPQFLIYYAIQPLPGTLVFKQIAFDTVRYLLLGLLVAYLQPRRLVL